MMISCRHLVAEYLPKWKAAEGGSVRYYLLSRSSVHDKERAVTCVTSMATTASAIVGSSDEC